MAVPYALLLPEPPASCYWRCPYPTVGRGYMDRGGYQLA